MLTIKALQLMLASLTFGMIACFGLAANKEEKQSESNNQTGFAVVELFTSEGCSSCPPADAAVAKLLDKNITNTYILSYHYWNRLGWKDEFSKPAFSARQQQYARSLSLEGVYTPQVIVNGEVEFVGSNESNLSSAVNSALNKGNLSNLKIKAAKAGNSVVINYTLFGGDPMLLNVTIVIPGATTQVKRGENGGRTLHHVNIVAELKVIEVKASGDVTMDIPEEIKNKPFKVIAYTQRKQNFNIVGVDEVDF